MSAAEAWQEWRDGTEEYFRYPMDALFMAGYRRALEDLTSEFYASGDPCKIAVAELLTARAAAVAPRETKD